MGQVVVVLAGVWDLPFDWGAGYKVWGIEVEVEVGMACFYSTVGPGFLTAWVGFGWVLETRGGCFRGEWGGGLVLQREVGRGREGMGVEGVWVNGIRRCLFFFSVSRGRVRRLRAVGEWRWVIW